MCKKNESGVSLLETVVALAVLGLVAVAFLSGLMATSRVTYQTDEVGTAVSLARLQIESVKAADYVYGASQYPSVPIPSGKDYVGYSVTVTAQPLYGTDDGIQKISVAVYRYGKRIFNLQGYKADR